MAKKESYCNHEWKNIGKTVDCGSFKQHLHGLECIKCGAHPTDEEYNDHIDRIMYPDE